MRPSIEVSTDGVANCLIYLDCIVAVMEDKGHAVVHLSSGLQIHLVNQTYKKISDDLKAAS